MGKNGRINPVCLRKEALKLWEMDAGIPRRPLTPGTAEEIADVRKAMVTFGVL
jgi:4-hydroxy-tetrahydrodipicolinate synthase